MTIESSNNCPRFDSNAILAKYDKDSSISLYLDQVLFYNEKVNIVSRETSRDKLISLAADCLVPLEFGVNTKGLAFDVGTGGGFPSVPLLLVNSSMKSTLIERTGKKAGFLSKMIEEFSLNADVINRNFVEAARSMDPGLFDFGLMKYVKLDRKIFAAALSLLKPNGKFIHYSRFDKSEIPILGDVLVDQHCYYLDDTEQVRTLTIFTKNN